MTFFVMDKSTCDMFEQIKINMELVLKKAGIPIARLTDQGLSLSKEEYIEIMYSLDAVVSDEQILMIGEVDRATRFLPPLFAAMCSKNGLACFERISLYKKLIGPFELHLFTDETELHLEFVFDGNETPLPRMTSMIEHVLMVGILRHATGLDLKPSRIQSIHEFGAVLNSFLGVSPVKSKRNILSFYLEDVKEPFLTRNNTMWSYLEPELKKRLNDLHQEESFSAKVRQVMFEMIPAGTGNVEDVAREMAMSVRTLQRKLKDEKTSFIKQLNHTRELMARNYLKNKSISNDEIAFLIGYSDANAFGRAFRSWTGMTIGDYKKSVS